jgi:tyrosyl-tRNA synthetase
VARANLATGLPLIDLLVTAGLAKSKSEARRLITQGGAAVNGETVTDIEARVTDANLRDGVLLLRAGKKRFSRVVAG